MPKRIPIRTRFLGKTSRGSEGCCWQWTGQVTKAGYARFSAYGQSVAAHRFSYEHFVGPIPPGMTIEHRCHTADQACVGGPTCLHRRCVNPAHLIPMSAAENTSLAFPARKTHCKAGHPFDETNTVIVVEAGNAKRRCRKCQYRRKNEHRARGRAAARAARPAKAKPTHCRYGHPYGGANLYVVPSSGAWQCRACNKATEERRRARRAAAA